MFQKVIHGCITRFLFFILLSVYSINIDAQTYQLPVGGVKFIPIENVPYDGAINSSSFGCDTKGVLLKDKSIAGVIVEITEYFSGTAIITCFYSFSYWNPYSNRLMVNYTETYFYITCQSRTATLNTNNLSLDVDDSYQLKYTLSGSGVSQSSKAIWTSSNTSVATVSDNGLVYAQKSGSATIYLETKVGPIVSCVVTVRNVPPTEIQIPENISINYQEERQVSYSLFPSNAFSNDIVWQSDDESIAKFSSGSTLYGVDLGITKVRAIVNGSIYSNWCIVKVNEPLFKAPKLSLKDESINVSLTPSIDIDYSLPITQGTAFGSISLTDIASGENEDINVTISDERLSITPKQLLREYSSYYLLVPSNSVKNQWGTHYVDDIQIHFKTVAVNNCLQLWLKDGTNITFSLDERPTISFEGENMILKTSFYEIYYPFETVDKFTMNADNSTDDVVSIDMEPDNHLSISDNMISLINLAPKSIVHVYSMNGSLKEKYTIGDNGFLVIPMDLLPKGVNIIMIGNTTTYKVLIK